MNKHYNYSNNPLDPCAYCVQWEWPEGVDQNDDPFMEQCIPMMPTYCVLILYKRIHKECDDMMSHYMTDTQGDNY